MAKQRPCVIDRDGFRVEWFSRRSQLDADVYTIEPDGTRGTLVTELVYPKVSGIGFNDFMPEVVMIAKREIEKAGQ